MDSNGIDRRQVKSSTRCPTPKPSERKLSIVSCSSLIARHFGENGENGNKVFPGGHFVGHGGGQSDILSIEDVDPNNMTDTEGSGTLFVLKNLIWSMKIIGLWPKAQSKFFDRLNPQSWVVFVYLHVYAVHNVVNWLFTYYQYSDFTIFLENASMVIRTGATAVTFDLFFIKYLESVRSIKQVGLFPFSEGGVSLMELKTPINLLVIASWAYLIMVLGFTSWSTATMGVQKFMDYYFYGFRVGHVNAIVMRFVMAFVWIAHIGITLSAEIFLKSFYVASCLLLGKTARAYNAMVANLGEQDTMTGADVNKVNKLHTQLTDLVHGVDKNFTLKAFIWISTIFLNLCIKIGIICIATDPSWVSNATLDIINYLVIFVVISLTAADVSLQCEILLPLAHRLAAKADMKNLTVLYQAKLMIAKMSHPIAQLTGWKCFVLDRPFILTITGTILTYSVVLMQMSKSMAAQNNMKNLIANNTNLIESMKNSTI